MALTVTLRDIGRDDLALAGGKGANLGELVRAGLPVPDGFVVTTEAYAGRGVRMPEAVRAAVAEAYAALGGGPVAVRSSATAEDLPGAAFAGQQDTYLNVLGEAAVLDAVGCCWESLWTDRAVAYRARLGIDPAEVSIAVVVQRMVEAEVAGVMFTADPVSGDRGRLVVDASSGLGEAVVSGLVTPDHYVLDDRGRVLECAPGRREVVVRGAAGGGVTREQGDPRQVERLPDHALAELARLGAAAERHLGRPQDLEWAFARDRVWLLQARPMTALPPPPVRLNRVERLMGAIIIELLPVRPYPIDMTTWVPYGPAGLMAEVVEFFGIRGPFEGFLTETDGVVYGFVPRAPHPTLGLLRAPFRIAVRARRHDPARWTEDPRFAAYLARVQELAGEDVAAMDWSQLTRVPRRALAQIRPITDLRIDYLPGTGVALLRLLVVLTLLRRRPLMRDLVLHAPTRTADANHALEALAAKARADPALHDAVAALDPDRLAAFPDFRVDFGAFLAQYGHRETATALLVTPPTWREDPATVLGLVRVLAASPPKGGAGTDHAMAHLLTHPLLRSRRARARMRRWVQQARAGVSFREDSHFYFTALLPVLRGALLEMGRRLQEVGVLSEPDDVFHLRLEELEGVGDLAGLGEPDRQRLRAVVVARSARRDELAGVPLIDPHLLFPPRDRGDALVSGTPAGGGTATGPVKVIREPAQFSELTSGDVLVCPYTNPSWTPLFQRAAAVVVDTGGLASHAAIVAREYGIPAVMGTGTGTGVLADGQLVTVDGGTGLVSAAVQDGLPG